MRKKQIIKIIGMIALLIPLVLSGNQFLYAEESSDDDVLNTEEIENNEEISIQENESEEVAAQGLQTYELSILEFITINDLNVKIDGSPYMYSPDEFSFTNILTLQFNDSDPHVIELHSEDYQFTPSVVTVDPTNPEREYYIKSTRVNDQYTSVYGKDGTQKDVYDNDETVTVSAVTEYWNHYLFYRFDGGEWITSKADAGMFEVHAKSKDAHEISVEYFVRYIMMGDTPTESEKRTMTVKFAAAQNGENSEEPDVPVDVTFTDEEGNEYTKDEIECKITEMNPADYEKYQRVIVNFDEYKGLEDNHILYYQAGLFAQDVRVQPNGMYELVLPYPQGASMLNDFVIKQFKDGNTDHPVTLQYTLDEDGIHVQVDNVSVFVVGWNDAEVQTDPDDKTEIDPTNPTNQSVNKSNTGTTGGVNTGDIFGINLWMILAMVSCFSICVVLRKKFHNLDHS